MGQLGVSQNTGVLVVLVAFALEERLIRWLLHLPHGFWFIFRHNRCCQLRDRDRKGRKKDRPTMVTDSDHRKQPHFNDLWVRLEATRSVKNEKLLLLMIIIIIVIVTDIILFCFLIHYILNCFKETWMWYTYAFSMVEANGWNQHQRNTLETIYHHVKFWSWDNFSAVLQKKVIFIFMNEIVLFLSRFHCYLFLGGSIKEKLELVEIMVWDWIGYKSLPEPRRANFTNTYISSLSLSELIGVMNESLFKNP